MPSGPRTVPSKRSIPGGFGSALGKLVGNTAGASLGGYSNTAEGKVIVAAFTDSFNNIVCAVRNYKQQTVAGGLGTGGNLAVQGDDDTPPPPPKKTTRKKKK